MKQQVCRGGVCERLVTVRLMLFEIWMREYAVACEVRPCYVRLTKRDRLYAVARLGVGFEGSHGSV